SCWRTARLAAIASALGPEPRTSSVCRRTAGAASAAVREADRCGIGRFLGGAVSDGDAVMQRRSASWPASMGCPRAIRSGSAAHRCVAYHRKRRRKSALAAVCSSGEDCAFVRGLAALPLYACAMDLRTRGTRLSPLPLWRAPPWEPHARLSVETRVGG